MTTKSSDLRCSRDVVDDGGALYAVALEHGLKRHRGK